MICETCNCVDSKDNCIIEILDENGCVERKLCLMCYAEELDDTNE